MADHANDVRRTYMESIRRHVCGVCLDRRDDGSCGLTRSVCAIEAHLPELVRAIQATSSRRMDDYFDAIQAQVCSGCERQDEKGSCELRETADCALLTYLPLLVDAIEAVDERVLVEAGACCA